MTRTACLALLILGGLVGRAGAAPLLEYQRTYGENVGHTYFNDLCGTPRGDILVVDGDGNLFRFSAAGDLLQRRNLGDGVTWPILTSVAWVDGEIWIGTGRILRLTPTGTVLGEIPLPWNTTQLSGGSMIYSLAPDADGSVLALDINQRLLRFDRDGTLLTSTGDGVYLPFTQQLIGMAIGSDGVHVVDGLRKQVYTLSPDGTLLGAWGNPGDQPFHPTDILETPAGTWIVADAGILGLQFFDSEGTHVGSLPLTDADGDPVNFPRALYLDAATGELHVMTPDEIHVFRILEVTPTTPTTWGGLKERFSRTGN